MWVVLDVGLPDGSHSIDPRSFYFQYWDTASGACTGSLLALLMCTHCADVSFGTASHVGDSDFTLGGCAPFVQHGS